MEICWKGGAIGVEIPGGDQNTEELDPAHQIARLRIVRGLT